MILNCTNNFSRIALLNYYTPIPGAFFIVFCHSELARMNRISNHKYKREQENVR